MSVLGSSDTNKMEKDTDTKMNSVLKTSKESFLSKARRLITVEPLLVIYMLSFQATLSMQGQFSYRKLLAAYANHSNPVSDISSMSNDSDGSKGCPNAPSGGEAQAKAQASAALLSIVLGLANVIPSLFSTVLLGSFSDRAGRKWGMIPPLIGDSLKNTLVICIIIFDLPFWQLLIVANLISGSLGNAMLVTNAAFSYIADISTVQQRMLRIVIIDILLGCADLAANLIIGHLIDKIGFLYSYTFLLCLNSINLLYVIFILKETVQRKPGAKLCSLANYSRTVKVYARGDVPGRRTILLICLLILTFQSMVEQGTNGPALDLYFMNVPLCWQSVALGYFRAFIVIVRFSFNALAIRLLLPKLKAGGLLLLGCGSLVIYDLCLAQVTANWVAYTAVITSFAVGMINPMVRGITSQKVEPHEQGALFAGQGITVLVSSLSGVVMYNMVYSNTVTTFSRTIFYVGAGQGAVVLVFASILFWNVRKYGVTQKPRANSVEKENVVEKQHSNTPVELIRF